MSQIYVSVIIPFYNNIEWLNEAVDSVLNQSFKNYEIILINDGSNDDILEFLNTYGSRITYRKISNQGPGHARNIGIAMAKGKYVAFLDSDDIWKVEKLDLQVEFMESTKAAWSHTNYLMFWNESSKKNKKIVDVSSFRDYVYPKCLCSTPIATPTVIIRNDVLKADPSLRFNEKMRFGQDWYLWINMAKKYKLYILCETLSKIRIRGVNAAQRARVQIKARTQIWNHIKEDREKYLAGYRLFRLLILAFILCSYGNRIIEHVEKKRISSPLLIELISRALYLLPYIIFKALYFYYEHKE